MKQPSFIVTPDLYTTRGNRFVHYLVDLIVILLIFYAIFFGFIFLYYSVVEDTTVMDNFLDNMENTNPILDRIVTAVILALLYFGLEFLTQGRSIGKFITKTKVVMADGSSPSSVDYIKRSFSRMIPFEALSFLGREGRGWHDSISGTYVVDIDRFEAKLKSQIELEQIGVPEEI
jgi:uncharacterized RDD family membrane protein YckC